MAKYILNIPDEIIEFMNNKFDVFIEPEVKVGECRHYKVRLDDTEVTPYTEPDRELIEDEVTGFWHTISLMATNILEEVFGESTFWAVLNSMTYQEARFKYDKWKREKKQICVGDEVKITDDGSLCVVCGIGGRTANLIFEKGDLGQFPVDKLIRTGRHFNEVEELLRKMEVK